jgi:hypothetical protein
MDPQIEGGRFLASRVYSRWRWAARFGLMVVPVLVLLCGGLILFLTPSKYLSKALVEVENGRSPQESAKMCKSSVILGQVVEGLHLTERLQVDHETAVEILTESVQVQVIPDTHLIEISATSPQKDLARNVAAEIPRSLAKFEKGRVESALTEKLAKLDLLILDARDAASEKSVEVSRIEKVVRQDASENAGARELERARRASLLADSEVERLLVLRADAATSLLQSEPRLIVHNEPVISDRPSNPKIGPELNDLALEALAAGLVVALLLPYLCELAFPPQNASEVCLDVVYDT